MNIANPTGDIPLYRCIITEKSTDSEMSKADWTAKVDDFGYCYGRPYVCIDDGAKTVCAVFATDERNRPIPNYRANAYKLAAALDLEAAVEALMHECGALTGSADIDTPAQQLARAALAKARGEAVS